MAVTIYTVASVRSRVERHSTLSSSTLKVRPELIKLESDSVTRVSHAGKPHNPMINAGALLLCAMLKPELSLTHKVDFVSQ